MAPSDRISLGLALAGIGANFVPSILPKLGRSGEAISRLLAVVLLAASVIVFLWDSPLLLVASWCVAFLVIAIQVLRSIRLRQNAQEQALKAEADRAEAERISTASTARMRILEQQIADTEDKLLAAERARQDAEQLLQAAREKRTIPMMDRNQILELKAKAGHAVELFTNFERGGSDHDITRLKVIGSPIRHYPKIRNAAGKLVDALEVVGALSSRHCSPEEFQDAVAKTEAAYDNLIRQCDAILGL